MSSAVLGRAAHLSCAACCLSAAATALSHLNTSTRTPPSPPSPPKHQNNFEEPTADESLAGAVLTVRAGMGGWVCVCCPAAVTMQLCWHCSRMLELAVLLGLSVFSAFTRLTSPPSLHASSCAVLAWGVVLCCAGMACMGRCPALCWHGVCLSCRRLASQTPSTTSLCTGHMRPRQAAAAAAATGCGAWQVCVCVRGGSVCSCVGVCGGRGAVDCVIVVLSAGSSSGLGLSGYAGVFTGGVGGG